ncbi:hypothetical protein CHS0354_032062 [Potamilus streckersoni]|uniref:Uncharacterized protein n=1 Tax=Potamilus streckersoni TaxID=2493646 RepID=A0AAE0WG87_9BIVA|nr:hypothetical protein CHS0354_032062 [Potamilus streckersoni]
MEAHFLFQFVIFLILWLPIRKATADDGIVVQTKNSYINVKWNATGESDKYDVSIQVMSTGYHSTVEVPGTQKEANITTISYPGSIYIVKLYAVHNDTKFLLGTRYVRSACGYESNTTMGSQYILLSPSYPNGYNAGVICRWYFHGNDVTWFKVILWDYDIEGTEKCLNSLQVSDVTTLCHPMERNHSLLVKNSSISLQMINKYTGPGRGMNVSVVGNQAFKFIAHSTEIM